MADLREGAVVFESLRDFNQVSVTPDASPHWILEVKCRTTTDPSLAHKQHSCQNLWACHANTNASKYSRHLYKVDSYEKESMREETWIFPERNPEVRWIS